MILSDFSIKLSRYFNKDAIYLTLIYVFLTDLVLGGAGTYLSYGSLSIRKVLFVILVLIMIYQVINVFVFIKLYFSYCYRIIFESYWIGN